jgi:hypothetical protein
MTSLTKMRTLALSSAAAVALTGAVTAEAGKGTKQRVKLDGNQTTIALSAPVSQALADNGVTVSLLGKATAGEGGSVVLPITGGRINPTNLRGVVRHAGGVKFTKGDRSLSLRRFTIVSTKRGAYLAVHVKGRGAKAKAARTRGRGRGRNLVLARLAGVQRSEANGVTTVTANLRLTQRAAKLIRNRFGVAAAQKGTLLGTVKVEAKPKS